MSSTTIRPLAPGYTWEVDTVGQAAWSVIIQAFQDANIYQTWPYATVLSGRRHASRLIVKRDGNIVAVAQARIAKVPFMNIGIAYIRWGPLWQRSCSEAEVDVFRQAIRALRNEFACKRGLVVRLFPALLDHDSASFSSILAEEGFNALSSEARPRTILMDISSPLSEIRESMNSHWKRELKLAERGALEVVEGTDDKLFEQFIGIYKEMVARKKFAEPNDINQFRSIQSQLPEAMKMKVMLCQSDAGLCAGLICSAIGNTAIYLFGATSNIGMKAKGSYLLHWKLLGLLKQNQVKIYNLNGINPERNPGTYKFKNDLAGSNGKHVYYPGRFDAHSGLLSPAIVRFGDILRNAYRSRKHWLRAAPAPKVTSAPPAGASNAGQDVRC
jgi:lipid II:glycine glycyltransferase (peptidoglycan interpeptide bridge formation enzyme)